MKQENIAATAKAAANIIMVITIVLLLFGD
jgi:uncharacterized membrane protein YtjA (UPF0391 family)